jgi:small conductance mechanosensitive channel
VLIPASLPTPDTDAVGESIEGFDSSQALTAAIIFAAGVVLALVLRAVVHRLTERYNQVIARLLSRAVAALTITVALVYALGEMGIRVGIVLGALGVGGIALAFALQDILSNLIAGIILQIRQPFTYRDLVRLDDYEGTVTDIKLRAVEMRLLSGETVIIPSSTVLQNPIENWTTRPTRRLSVDVGVAYDTDMELAADLLVEALSDVDAVLDEPPPIVAFDSFADSSINFTAMFWFTSTDDFHTVKRVAATSIKRVFDREGIEIPFPIRTLVNPDGSAISRPLD